MISRDFPVRLWLAGLTALMVSAALAACTASDTEAAPSSSAKTSRSAPPPPPIALSQTLPTETPHGSHDPDITRVGDVTVLAYYDTVRAVTRSGVRRWSFPLPAGVYRFGLGVAVDGATTVLSWQSKDGDARLRAVDTATGRLRWTYRTSDFIETVAGTVFATACAERDTKCIVRALETTTGAVRWTHPVAGQPYVRVQDDVADHGLLAPAIGTKAILEVYTGGTFSDTSHLEILDVATGRTRPMPVSLSSSSYARAGDAVVFAPFDGRQGNGCTGRLVAVDLQTGRLLWSRSYPLTTPTADSEAICGDLRLTALGDGMVAVHPADGRPSLLDIRTGRPVAAIGTVTGTAVARAGEVTLVQRPVPEYGRRDSLTVHGVRSDGTNLWQLTLDGSKDDAVSSVAGLIVVGGEYVSDPTVAVRATTGAVVARYDGRLAAHGENWFATWDQKVVRIYDVRG